LGCAKFAGNNFYIIHGLKVYYGLVVYQGFLPVTAQSRAYASQSIRDNLIRLVRFSILSFGMGGDWRKRYLTRRPAVKIMGLEKEPSRLQQLRYVAFGKDTSISFARSNLVVLSGEDFLVLIQYLH
jgi:hypothetical protein